MREWITPLFQQQRPERVLFRVDAGRVPGLSFGHLERCLLLSRLFKELFGSNTLFLMRRYEEGVARARQQGEDVEDFSGDVKERALLKKATAEFQPDWLVVDLPYEQADCSFFPELRQHGCKVLFIDDARFMDPEADVVLNSSILAPGRLKERHGETTYLLGPSYFIFDRSAIPATQTDGSAGGRILLTFGGSDPTGLTIKVVGALLSCKWPGLCFTVVVGPGFGETDSLSNLLKGGGGQYRVMVNPESLLSLAMESDLTLCAGGRTMYELSYLEQPFMAIASAPHEAEAIGEFQRQGLARAGICHWQPAEFIGTLKRVLNEGE